jgi:preprotein translocase subunit YajC
MEAAYFYGILIVAMLLVFGVGIRRQLQQRQKQIDLLERIATALEQRKF